ITVGIGNYDLANVMKLYPNPTKDVVNVQLTMNNEQLEGVSIQLFDVYGRLLEVINMADAHGASPQTPQIDLSRYAKGVYFVKAVSEGKIIAVRKVVKN
ncbi:MAG: T9SS type A sorting domain-containing protein, partial [Bacteroidales bacterium]|nr:T9SS type A sorting domain-containing protein [Bacteroidales bacterium]